VFPIFFNKITSKGVYLLASTVWLGCKNSFLLIGGGIVLTGAKEYIEMDEKKEQYTKICF